MTYKISFRYKISKRFYILNFIIAQTYLSCQNYPYDTKHNEKELSKLESSIVQVQYQCTVLFKVQTNRHNLCDATPYQDQ